ncbi:flagellar biosynthesis protein [Klebsiella pneumoniae]|uniref:flagellar biosynthesis protein n=1 Tax=Klebsiella pneumoniae TaxID=573 RepID=UPI001D0F4BB1|nr:flagellar biosynthesis protein [Klebsiella pneumoniae]
MSTINGSVKWENDIPLITRGDKVAGGKEGLVNIQTEKLVNRTEFLRDKIDATSSLIKSGDMPYASESAAQKAIVDGVIPADGLFSVRSENPLLWCAEYKNISGVPVPTGKNIASSLLTAPAVRPDSEDPQGLEKGLSITDNGQAFYVIHDDKISYYRNDGGEAVPFLDIPSSGQLDNVNGYVTSRLYNSVMPGISFLLQDDETGVIMFGDDEQTHVPALSLKYGSDMAYSVASIPGVAHVELDENENVLRWVDDSGIPHGAAKEDSADQATVISSSPVISPQFYDAGLVSEIGYNQWINNVAVKFGRDYFFSGVRLGTTAPERILGNLAICRRQGERGKFGCYEFGPRAAVLGDTASTDDHDAPSILLDTRAGAKKPIMIFQADHSGATVWLRKWAASTLDPANLTGPETVSDTSNMTYAQSYRNPNNQDEILVFARRGSTNSARWVVHYSTDNGETWRSNPFIGGSDLYMTSCQSADGEAVHIAIQQHPRSTDTRVLYMKIEWDSKSLVNYAGGVLLADVTTDAYVNPFGSEIPDVVFEASLDTNTKRLFEVKDDGASLLFLVAEFNAKNYSYRRMKLSKFSGSAPVIFDVGDCGSPMNDDDATFYVPGGTIISDSDVLVCSWAKVPAMGRITRYTFDGEKWNGTIIDEVTDGRKICRPLVFREYYQSGGVLKYQDTNTVVYLRGVYNAYRDFDLDAVLINV